MWSPSGCGGTDGLGIIAVLSDSRDAVLWSQSSIGSTDSVSIPASVDAVADAVVWSPLCCGCYDAMGVPDDVAVADAAADDVSFVDSILLRGLAVFSI